MAKTFKDFKPEDWAKYNNYEWHILLERRPDLAIHRKWDDDIPLRLSWCLLVRCHQKFFLFLDFEALGKPGVDFLCRRKGRVSKTMRVVRNILNDC